MEDGRVIRTVSANVQRPGEARLGLAGYDLLSYMTGLVETAHI